MIRDVDFRFINDFEIKFNLLKIKASSHENRNKSKSNNFAWKTENKMLLLKRFVRHNHNKCVYKFDCLNVINYSVANFVRKCRH